MRFEGTSAISVNEKEGGVPQPASLSCDFLVTGGFGRLGTAIVGALSARGFKIRVLSRRTPQAMVAGGIEVAIGDLADPSAVDRAMRGANAVIHAGAAMSGDANAMKTSTVIGTANVLAAMRRQRVRRLVHVSSLSVVDWAGGDRAAPLSEDAADEPKAEFRGVYTQTKLESERLVRAAAAEGLVDAVILRPGQIWGGGIPLLTTAVRHRVCGFNVVLGNGDLRLPLVHIDDVVQAVILSLSSSVVPGTIIQLVNPAAYTQNDLLNLHKVRGAIIRLPRLMVFAVGGASEVLLALVGRRSPFNVYRLRSALARVRFESNRAQELISWRPRADERQDMIRELAKEHST